MPPAELRAISQSANDFGFALWQRVRDTEGNLSISPSSISLALGMTFAGARGQTADEMRRTLRFGRDDDATHRALGGLTGRWNRTGRPYEMSVANRLFGAQGFRFEPSFLTVVRDRYGAPLEPVDFGQSEQARRRINGWVEDRTRDRIRDLLPAGSIDAGTRLVLTNALYFKGRWAAQFDPADTRTGAFQAPRRAVQVPLMHRTGDYRHARVDGVQIIELPYRGDELAMDVILPERPDGLAALEARLSPEALARWLEAMHEQEVQLTLPRFRISPAASIRLRDPLSAMGMTSAFGAGADFSGMAPGLWIDDVYHKTFVEVNEEGTEAAAATAVVMTESAAMHESFTADRPFLFLIRDVQTGAVIFIGRVADPS